MKRILIFLLIVFIVTSIATASVQDSGRRKLTPPRVSQTEEQEWQDLQKRFAEYWPHMSGLVWTLIHSYASKTEMERSLKLLESISLSISSKDAASIRNFNGPRGFKQELVRLMRSKDQTVSGFAAKILGIIGDLDYAPRIAALLDTTDAQSIHKVTVRGQAASALGLLGARQYAPRIARLLRSENEYDRAGATSGLGLLKATEYAGDVVRLLGDGKYSLIDEGGPIYCLFEMGVAGKYTSEIAHVLDDEIPGDRTETAAYALARLEAKEHARDIAKLFKHEFRKGAAAKALALLGAKEYAGEILLLLEDKQSFNRRDGAVALGILGAREHAKAVAKLLKDPEGWVEMGAAQALVLMEANEYADKALPIIAKQKTGPYFHTDDFNALVKDQAAELDNRFTTLLARMKAQSMGPQPK